MERVTPMEDDAALMRLFGVLDTLGRIAQAMDPRRLDALVAQLDGLDLRAVTGDGPGGGGGWVSRRRPAPGCGRRRQRTTR